MPLCGIWPIPINQDLGPIELENGISLVTCCKSDDDQEAGENYVISIHGKGEIKGHSYLSHEGHPLSKLPRMGLLFEVQKKERDQLFMPHHYANAAIRPKTILRLFQAGEFLPSMIIYEHGFYSYVPARKDADLQEYEIPSDRVEPLKSFYAHLLIKWKKAEELLAKEKDARTFSSLFKRLDHAVQFLDKSYFDEFGFTRTIGTRSSDKCRNENFLRLIFCWMGIESLVCNDEEKIKQLKNNLPLFLSTYKKERVEQFVDAYYDLRSVYVHANPEKMRSIRNSELNTVRDVLKLLILIYFELASTNDVFDELSKDKLCDPVKALVKIDLSPYCKNVKDNSGAKFDSYCF